MKIAICSDIYYPMTNGIAVFAHNLAIGLRRRGHEVLVISPSFTGKKHSYTDPKTGVKTQYLSSKRFFFYPDQIHKVPEKKEVLGMTMPRLTYKNGIWWSVHPWKELKKTLDAFQPDVIHLQTAETIALATMSYVRKRNVPLVTTGHAYPDNVTQQFKFLGPIRRPVNAAARKYRASFLKHAEYATMPTEMAIEDLVPKNRKRFQVTVEALSNGVDLSCFKPGKPSAEVCKKYNIDPRRPRVLYVGRVDPEKSIETVLEAFALAISDARFLGVKKDEKRLEKAELLIAGDGTDKAHLEDAAEKLGISERVKCLGRVMPPELYEIYRAGTLFATASETETQGIVLIEAAATGLPLVAVDGGAVGEVCRNRKNGFLCAPGDATGMAKVMRKLISDPELCKKMGKASLEIAKKHDINHTLTRFEEIYQEAIEQKRAKLAWETET